MKKYILALTFLLATLMLAQSQPPQALKYKAVAKDEWGVALPSKEITLRFTILLGSETGTVVYQELHYTTTNKFGLMDVNIGEGNPLEGYFDQIDWGAGSYYMKVELDTKGGLDFRLEGADKLLSVPYALYAGNATNSGDNDSDPENELITSMYLSGTILYIIEAGTTHMVDLWSLQGGNEDDDADPTNELQDLTLSGSLLSITQGSTIDLGTLPDLVEDADADPLNEIQDLQLAGDVLTITGNSSATTIDLSQYFDNTDDQLLTLAGYELSIENGNSVTLPDLVDDADADPTNELQDISLIETSLNISNGSSIDLSVLQDGFEPDTDDQTLSIDGYNLTISEGNTIVLPDEVNDADNDPTNELQTLTLVSDQLVLSQEGGIVPLPPCDNTAGQYYFADKDGDGFGTIYNQTWVPQGVAPPPYYVNNNLDCNDNDYTTQDGTIEFCDGIDNDCDGLIDNNLTPPLAENQLGVCLGLTKVCAGALGWQEPDYAAILAEYELYESLCDELDNDCDGLVDETCQCTNGETRPCEIMGTGSCAQGIQTCENGYWSDCITGEPAQEICDGIDNDCDGEVDEDWPQVGQPCIVGEGACENQGYYTCNSADPTGPPICSVNPTPGPNYEEVETICDYIDNDCNGIVDDPYIDPATGLYVDDQNCGGCGISCENFAPNAIGFCTIINGIAQCDYTCAEGFIDLNGSPADGCEFAYDISAVYVASPSNGGSDISGCGEFNNPCATITNGIQQAITNPGKTKVLVSSGVYPEAVQLENGISVMGGYNPITWEENPAANITTISGLQTFGIHQFTVSAMDINSPTTFSGFNVRGPQNQNPSGNSYVLYVNNSSAELSINNNIIIGGTAGNGIDGLNGDDGQNGTPGGNGVNTYESATCMVAMGGSGGSSISGAILAHGGDGGAVQCPIDINTQAGDGLMGGASGTLSGGSGGSGGWNSRANSSGNCSPTPDQSQVGTPGTNGQDGPNGSGGDGAIEQFGNVINSHWQGQNGNNGTPGTFGSGGGGGGASGGYYLADLNSYVHGGTGGGGGSGAECGYEGQGGNYGGSSFCVFVANSSVPILSDNTIVLGYGGNGGTGGIGGVGGYGGTGGLGGSLEVGIPYCVFPGASGGDGGNGGHGGGGGGGAGGCSFGIYTYNLTGTPDYVTDNTFSGGLYGRGGYGGSSIGNPGEDGTDGVVEHVSYH